MRKTAIWSALCLMPMITAATDFGHALEFDGISSYTLIDHDPELNVAQYTLTAWVHPYSYTRVPDATAMEVLEKTGSYWVNISSVTGSGNRTRGQVRVGGYYGPNRKRSIVDSKTVIPLNTWTHVACIYDGQTLAVYINGERDADIRVTDGANYADSGKLALGSRYNSEGLVDTRFHGMLDEVGIWNKALDASAIQALLVSSPDASHADWETLIAFYRFDEDSLGRDQGVFMDSKGPHHGMNHGATWVTHASSAAVGSDSGRLPRQFGLLHNHPNPFNPATTISYELNQSDHIHLTIYNPAGQIVSTLMDQVQEAGSHQVRWSAEGLPSGIYFTALRTAGTMTSRKMLLVN